MSDDHQVIRPPAGVAGQGAENADPHQVERVMADLFWAGEFGWQKRDPWAGEFRQLQAARQRAIEAAQVRAIEAAPARGDGP
jgi:hypothetical protein